MRGTLITLALLPLLAYAQSWCPPGATWHYNYVASQGQYRGYVRVHHESDTIILGETAQTLVGHWHYTWMPSLTNGDEPFGRWHTRTVGDRVELWTGSGFDTLFRFDAVPGDHWDHPPSSFDDYILTLEVTDTSTVLIDGVALRRQTIQAYIGYESAYPEPMGPATVITERLGGDFIFLWTSQLVYPDWAPAHIRCYSDFEISYSSVETACDLLLSVQDLPERDLMLFPNPGTTHFTLSLKPGPHTITLFDATGRVVLEQRTTEERPVIDTDDLPAGLYRIAVRDDRGGSMSTSWVKE